MISTSCMARKGKTWRGLPGAERSEDLIRRGEEVKRTAREVKCGAERERERD